MGRQQDAGDRVADGAFGMWARVPLRVHRQSGHIGAHHARRFTFKYDRELSHVSLHSGIFEDALAQIAGIVAVPGDPDFFAGLRIDEEFVRALASPLLDEASLLQFADDFPPRHLSQV